MKRYYHNKLNHTFFVTITGVELNEYLPLSEAYKSGQHIIAAVISEPDAQVKNWPTAKIVCLRTACIEKRFLVSPKEIPADIRKALKIIDFIY